MGRIYKVVLVVLLVECLFRCVGAVKTRSINPLIYGFRQFNIKVMICDGYVKLKEKFESDSFDNTNDPFFKGFRTKPFDKKTKERIVCMGGSSTFGLYDKYENSYPVLLEQKLGNVEVINTGLPAQSTFGCYKLLEKEVLAWKPDAVILYSLYNHMNFDSFEIPLIVRRLYEKSYIVALFVHRVYKKNKVLGYTKILESMIKLCKKNNIRLIVVKQLINPDALDRLSTEGLLYYPIIDYLCKKYDIDMVDFSYLTVDDVGKLLCDKEVHLSMYGKKELVSRLWEEYVGKK